MTEKYFVFNADAEPVEVLPGLTRRTLGQTADMMIVEFHGNAGVVLPEHSHPHQQVGYCSSGEIILTVNGVKKHCKPGDSWQVPGGVIHQATFPVDSIVIDIFSPPREDYQD
ncbi:MAG: cupin domain-containing protein [Anaerolineae bacterium]|nr:cupin domain-containing protein [Anaerolineae bacterium]